MSELALYYPVAEAISLLLHPYGEVVIHDLNCSQIVAIYNNLSKREVGSESLLEELPSAKELPDVFPVYYKSNYDGRRMKSTTATLRDKKGKPIGLLCINLDLSKWEEISHFLGEWLGNINQTNQPELLFKDDWREKINTYVSEYLKRERATLKTLSKEKKRELVGDLRKKGAFTAKHAASYVADVLCLSRATIYNYLR